MAHKFDDWPTLAEAAEQLNASLRTIWRHNERGQLEIQKRARPGLKPVNVVNPRDLDKLKPAPYVTSPAPIEETAVQVRKAQTPSLLDVERIVSILQGRHDAVTIDRKPILKLSEVRQLTGISVHRLKQAIEAGSLKAYRDGEWGRGYRLRRSDLDAYIVKGPKK
jgi:excisionase family DNA binding protein